MLMSGHSASDQPHEMIEGSEAGAIRKRAQGRSLGPQKLSSKSLQQT